MVGDKMIYEIKTHNPEETLSISERLGKMVQAKDTIILEGDLGAGKTTFTKGLAKGLGVKRVVNSPTFNIIKEYKGRIPLYHMDVYRLQDSEEDLGFDEYFDGEGVCVVEWAHLIEPQLPEELLKITIRRLGDTERKIVLEPIGERYIELCKELKG